MQESIIEGINSNFKAYIFDFDGVILDAVPIRTAAFLHIFRTYPKEAINAFKTYHLANAGISRFAKIRYFFEQILMQPLDEETEQKLINEFRLFTIDKLYNKDLLIADTLAFIEHLPKTIQLFIASGSEENELKPLCEYLEISPFFKKIVGSPTPKTQNVAQLIQEFNLNPNETLLIGDSHKDCEAAHANSLTFYGYNNPELKNIGEGYIETFLPFSLKERHEK